MGDRDFHCCLSVLTLCSPTSKSEHVQHGRTREFNQNTSLAANLPVDILTEILTQASKGDSEYDLLVAPNDGRRSVLLNASYVCKRWSQAALLLLYYHIHLSSPTAHEAFLIMLKNRRPLKEVRILTVTYMPPEERYFRRAAKVYLRGCYELLKMREVLPALANSMFEFALSHPITLMLIWPGAPSFLGPNIVHLSSLHLKPPNYWGIFAQERISFPNLRSLTLEQIGIFANTALPITPNLEKLTLLHVALYWDAHQCDWFQTALPRLKCLELIHVLDASETMLTADIFYQTPIGRSIYDTLEVLIYFRHDESRDHSYCPQMLKSFKQLKEMCFGPYLFPWSTYLNGDIGAIPVLPSSIERIRI
jgi:hypothetical protein